MVESARETRLREFVTWAARLAGDEKGEAQVFLDRLLQGFGHGGVKEAGAVLEKRIKSRDRKGTAFADLVWKPYVLIEMKKRGEDLARHRRQAFDYWTHLAPKGPAWCLPVACRPSSIMASLSCLLRRRTRRQPRRGRQGRS